MPSRELGALLGAARRRAGMTQARLADLSGIDRGQLAGYESGKVDPGLSQLQKIARALNLDILSEPVPREEPEWVEEFRERLSRIEHAVGPEGLENVVRRTAAAVRNVQRSRAG